MAGRNRRESASDEFWSLEDQMKTLNLDEKRDINILLLGETGVGKSTFINSFCNYLHSPELQSAMKCKLTTLIPTKFTITDENYEEQVVQVGADENEFEETGVSATQCTRSYVFPIKKGKVNVRLIDTPGIGDTRGIDQDNINFENILSFIGELKHLNAICILLKPNSPRLTIMFQFCIKQLLSRLERSASRNLVFVFTNSRGTFYRPGETLPNLKKLLAEVKSVDIPMNKNNIFCTDNEAFRFLAAANNGIKFTPMDISNFAESWKKSVHECWRMIWYIAGTGSGNSGALVPHLVKKTISVNEARRLIVQLSQPLAEIAQLIQDNITILYRHKHSLEVSDNTLADLKRKLYVPVINLRVIPMKQPTTVCTSPQCSQVYQVGDKQKWHYQQKCHSPCYLRNVPKEMIGSPELASCAAMNGTTTCKKCSCSYQVHMHIYYETETYEEKVENEAVKSEITDKSMALMKARNVVLKIERRLKEYGEERDIIVRTTAKFAHFLQENAITPYNDAYEGYLLYLIDREKSMGPNTDYEVINEFRQMLQRYTEEKNALNRALAESTDGIVSVSADDVINCVKSLYDLKHNGQKIKELFDKQKSARKDENHSATREYVHASAQKKPKKRKNKNKARAVNDTTDSEYTTDCSQKSSNYIPKQGLYNKQNFVPNQYNQRSQYNEQSIQQYNQHQRNMNRPSPDIIHNPGDNHQKTSPLQYLHIKQGPSGQFDLRMGQANQEIKGHTSEPTADFRAPSPMTLHQGPQSYQNHGAYPKHTSNDGPPQRQYNQHQQYNNRGYKQSRGRSNPRSHSPNPHSHYNPQGQANYNQNYRSHSQGPQNYGQHRGPSNQGSRPFHPGQQNYNQNQGPNNQSSRPFNQGPQNFHQNDGPTNQGPRNYGQYQGPNNQDPRSFNQRPQNYNQNQGPNNQGPRSFNQGPQNYNNYRDLNNQDGNAFNQGPKPFNQAPRAPRPFIRNYYKPNQGNQPFEQRYKSANNQMQSDSGCESAAQRRGSFKKNKIQIRFSNYNRKHCLEDSSSESSSDSSSDESYQTCK